MLSPEETAKNERRIDLIQQETLTPAEQTELDGLQSWMEALLAERFPLPRIKDDPEVMAAVNALRATMPASTTEAAPDIYKRVIDLLEAQLTVDEMVKFHETLDEDPTNDFFWRLSETVARLRPDLFVTPYEMNATEVEKLQTLIANPPAPTAKLIEAMERHRDKGGK